MSLSKVRAWIVYDESPNLAGEGERAAYLVGLCALDFGRKASNYSFETRSKSAAFIMASWICGRHSPARRSSREASA